MKNIELIWNADEALWKWNFKENELFNTCLRDSMASVDEERYS